MRKKEERLIAAFYSTHDAMAFEDFCHERGEEGRLIPLPGQIRAGCGLAWSAPPDSGERLRRLLAECGIEAEALCCLAL